MMGRVVFALCAFTSTALACPPRYDTDDTKGAAIGFALMGLCVVAYAITRGNAVRRTFATSRHLVDIELEKMKCVARMQRSRTAWFALGCLFLLTAISWLDVDLHAQVWLSVSPAIMFVFAAYAWCELQMLQWLQPEPDLRVSAHGDYLFVSRGRRLVGWVAASPKLLARANALPVATLRT